MPGLSRRAVLAAPALIGAATLGSPREAVAQAAKVLKTRSLLDVAVLDPANRISVTDGDVMRALFAGLVRMKPGDPCVRACPGPTGSARCPPRT